MVIQSTTMDSSVLHEPALGHALLVLGKTVMKYVANIATHIRENVDITAFMCAVVHFCIQASLILGKYAYANIKLKAILSSGSRIGLSVASTISGYCFHTLKTVDFKVGEFYKLRCISLTVCNRILSTDYCKARDIECKCIYRFFTILRNSNLQCQAKASCSSVSHV